MKITKIMVENVRYMAKNGTCEGIDCEDCPFCLDYDNGVECRDNCSTISIYATDKLDEFQKSLAKKWLLENKEEIEKLELVEIENNKFETITIPKAEYKELLAIRDELLKVTEMMSEWKVKNGYPRNNKKMEVLR